jgi:hypothetical protein
MAKLKIHIDTENREHGVGNEGGKLRELSEAEYRKIEAAANEKDKENAVVIFTHNSPGCVTLYFRGRPYQV